MGVNIIVQNVNNKYHIAFTLQMNHLINTSVLHINFYLIAEKYEIITHKL